MSDHYFSEKPSTDSTPSTVRLALSDIDVKLSVDSGVFASRAVDRGTQLLLERAREPTAAGDLLDVGCGYGPITVTLAKRNPDRKVWAVDVNERALGLTLRNVRKLRLDNVTVCKPDEVPAEVRFAGIFSNPPIRVGKAALHDLLLQWLQRLDVGGSAQLVVHKHLGSDSLAKWLTSRGFSVDRISSSGGFRILVVELGSSSTTEPSELSGPVQ